MYFASGSCTRVLPPNKRQKAPKIAWTRCPSYFSIPPSATQVAPTSLCKGGKKVYLISTRRALATLSTALRAGFCLHAFFIINYLLSSLSQIGFVGLQGEQPSFSLGKNCSTGKSIPWKVSHGLEVLQLHSLSGMQ